MIKALIFDVDGTLAETEEAHRRAFNQTFEEFHLEWHWSRETYRELLKITGGKERMRAYQNAHPNGLRTLQEPEIRAIHKVKTQLYTQIVQKGTLKLRPGISRLMQLSQKAGIRLAIATTTSLRNVDALVHSCWGRRASDLFEVIAAGDEVRDKKPAPDVYLLALKRLGLSPEECVAFEDSHNGLLSAKAAGLPVYATPSRYTSRDDFSKADWLAEKLRPEKVLYSLQRMAAPRLIQV